MGIRRPTAIATAAAAVAVAAVVGWTVAGSTGGVATRAADAAERAAGTVADRGGTSGGAAPADVVPAAGEVVPDEAAGSAADGAAPAVVPAPQQRDTAVTRIDTLPSGEVTGVARADTVTPAQAAMEAHHRAERGPQQPIPFSHRFHVSELQIGCDYCHGGAERSQVAPVPAMSVCMGCHRTVGRDLPSTGQIESAWSSERPIAWNRVYDLPEFVQFRHRPHLRNDIECQECHGPVEQMDRVYRASSLSMGWCLSCHREQPQDSDVATDAKLVREAHLPDAPDGRQPVGLYPRTIETGYAGARAPDDCATCHY